MPRRDASISRPRRGIPDHVRPQGRAQTTTDLHAVEVEVVGATGSTPRHMLKVSYSFKVDVVLAVSHQNDTGFDGALLSPNYASQAKRVSTECTKGGGASDPFAA